MRIRYIATGKASWDNGLADILPQNLPNKHSRKKKQFLWFTEEQNGLSFGLIAIPLTLIPHFLSLTLFLWITYNIRAYYISTLFFFFFGHSDIQKNQSLLGVYVGPMTASVSVPLGWASSIRRTILGEGGRIWMLRKIWWQFRFSQKEIMTLSIERMDGEGSWGGPHL